jgi:hypothetical protein
MLEIDSELNIYQHWSVWNPTSTNQKMRIFWCISKDLWILCLWPPCCPIPNVAMNEFSWCIFYLLIYVSKLMNMCLMRTQLFRWSDRHIAPPTVLTRRAVVIYRSHHPWHRGRLSWPPKPKCCARFCRRNSKSPNRCIRGLQWELIMKDHRWLPPILKDRYGEPERREWMGADKNSSRRRWKLQQDEHDFQHTSPTHYPSWPSPRSHWSATRPRNHHTTFRPENAAKHQTLSPLIWEGNHSPKNHEGFPQISPIKSPRARSRKHPKKPTKRGLWKSPPRTTANNTTRPWGTTPNHLYMPQRFIQGLACPRSSNPLTRSHHQALKLVLWKS